MPTKETQNSSSNLHFYHQYHLDKKILRIMFSKQRRLFSKNEILMFLTFLANLLLLKKGFQIIIGNKRKPLFTGKFSSLFI